MPRSWQRFDKGAFEYFKLQLSPMTATITIVTMIMIITETTPIINIINIIVVVKPMGVLDNGLYLMVDNVLMTTLPRVGS